MSIKVIISDVSEGHANNVKSAFLESANGFISSEEIEIRYNGIAADLVYAVSVGATCLIRSTTGASGLEIFCGQYYRAHGIQTFMPAGSNTEGFEVYESNGGVNLPNIILTGAGDIDNETADDIEFFAPDTITGEPDLSSYANGYIAGQIFIIKQDLSCSWWEARYRARVTGSKGNIWHEQDGFGLIDFGEASSYSDEIPDDPYAELGSVGTLILAQNQNTVSLTAGRVDNSVTYVFERDNGSGWTVIQNAAWLSCNQTLVQNVSTLFRYKAINEEGGSAYSNIETAIWSVPEPDPVEPVFPEEPVVEYRAYHASLGARKFA